MHENFVYVCCCFKLGLTDSQWFKKQPSTFSFPTPSLSQIIAELFKEKKFEDEKTECLLLVDADKCIQQT